MKLRAPTVARAIVVKPAPSWTEGGHPRRHRRSAPLTRTPSCIWPGCGANLGRDHDLPVCSCHVQGRIPHHRDDRLVLHLLIAAYPRAVDLCAVLKCGHHELQATIRRLRRRGHTVSGARRGYVYEITEAQWR